MCTKNNVSEYDKKAEEFLKKNDVKLYISYKETTNDCPWDNENPHDRFRIEIYRKKAGKLRCFSFNFFGSVAMCREGKRPTHYDILADLSLYINFPPSLDDFINEFGYTIACVADFRRLEKQFHAGKKMQQKTRKMFFDCLDELAEIM